MPYAEFSPDDEELVRGNPNLEATTSMNFDLMYENYFENIGIVSGGIFYKDLDNFIYEQRVEGFNDAQFGNDLEYTTFQNGGTAEIYGLRSCRYNVKSGKVWGYTLTTHTRNQAPRVFKAEKQTI